MYRVRRTAFQLYDIRLLASLAGVSFHVTVPFNTAIRKRDMRGTVEYHPSARPAMLGTLGFASYLMRRVVHHRLAHSWLGTTHADS